MSLGLANWLWPTFASESGSLHHSVFVVAWVTKPSPPMHMCPCVHTHSDHLNTLTACPGFCPYHLFSVC